MLRNTVGEGSLCGKRVLVIGAKGFIGQNLSAYLREQGCEVKEASSQDVDLLASESVEELVSLIETVDVAVMLSALTPDKGKGVDVYIKNIVMAKHVAEALKKASNKPHFIYFSSDAVYNFDCSLVDEKTPAAPIDTYGSMHRARELIFGEVVSKEDLTVVRSTLVYGPGDTHNSYGPNRLRREAFTSGTMTLFGEGEDVRSHLYIKDLVRLIGMMIVHKSVGIINAAPDRAVSFMELAKVIGNCFEQPIKIVTKPGAAEPTYRRFCTDLCHSLFPGFKFTELKEGLVETIQAMQKNKEL